MGAQIEDYFDIRRPDNIRLRGTNLGIESILYEYLHNSQTPEQIAQQFPEISLEQVYATILYYQQDKERLGNYVKSWLAFCHQASVRLGSKPEAIAARLRELRAELDSYPPEEWQAVQQRLIEEGKEKRSRGTRRRHEPREYTAYNMNEPNLERWGLFCRRMFELYELLLERRRQNEGDNPVTVVPAPIIDTSSMEAAAAEIQKRIDAVLEAPEITNGEKNELLRFI